MDEEMLMQQIQQYDDESAFEQLIHRHYKSWIHFAMRMGIYPSIAEEMVQETCIRIWDKRKTWYPTAKVKTWCYTILYRICLDYLKSTANQITEIYSDNDGGNFLIEDLEKEEILFKLKAALAKLPLEQRAIFILHYYQNLKQDELCHLFEMSQSTLESLLFRIRKKLRETLL